MTTFLSSANRSDRICLGIMELGFVVLSIDPSCSTAATYIESNYRPAYSSLRSAASILVRTIARNYPTHRSNLTLSLLILLNRSYSSKTPYRSERIELDDEVNPRHVTLSLITLLSCIQATVATDTSSGAESVASSQLMLLAANRMSAAFVSELLKVSKLYLILYICIICDRS